MIVLNSLADQMYVTGELSGKADNMIAAEKDAADEIRRYIASGATAGLLGKGNGQPSPLQVAAYMGYPNVVAALLKSDLVRSRINDADKGGMTPWMDAALSMKQTLWACNSAVYDDPFVFVPMLVTQPYYISNPEPPYKKTLEMLEEAGASPDVVKAKKFWLTHCKSQSEEGKAKVRASDDLQTTVQELGLNALTSELSKRQKDDDEYRQRQCTHDFSGGLWICRGRVN
ncbi:hypothetical protein [Paraburkholderia youngii]|uniref:hypothetical protein n=1 Tax=Paraburkholderia youngii TaxID=2782701 RepID=UPI003D1AF090